MTTLEARHYVATVADIEQMARTHDDAVVQSHSTGGTYLRALIATVQSELGVEPRERGARSASDALAPAEVSKHLEAMERVNARFYKVVLTTLSGAAAERNRKSTWARSAASTLRRWIRAGNDIARLAAARVTRDALESAIPASSKRKPLVRVVVFKRRAHAGVLTLVSAAMAADKKERGAGIGLLQDALTAITAQLVTMGGVAVARGVDVGVRDVKPFKSGNNVFWPVGTGAS